MVVSGKPLPKSSVVELMTFEQRLDGVSITLSARVSHLRKTRVVTYTFAYIWCNPSARFEQVIHLNNVWLRLNNVCGEFLVLVCACVCMCFTCVCVCVCVCVVTSMSLCARACT